MGRRGFDVVLEAWRRGCRFDAWTDQFHYDVWLEAGKPRAMDLEEVAAETFDLDARLPWDHTSPGVSKGFLQREWRRAMEGVTTPDCTMTSCTGCGVCPTLGVSNVIAGDRHGGRTIGKPDLNRLRVRFGKDGRLAYLGHLEVINTIERSVRRAGLPFSVGNGFARRMRIQFSQALPVGAASRDEYYDLYLTERVDARGGARAPCGPRRPAPWRPSRLAYVGGELPALEAWLTRSRLGGALLGDGEGFSPQALDEALEPARGGIDRLHARGQAPHHRARTTRSCRGSCGCGGRRAGTAIDLTLKTRSSNLGALRPAVLLEAAFAPGLEGATLDSLRVLRVGQWHEDEDGSLIDPLDPGLLCLGSLWLACDSACLVESRMIAQPDLVGDGILTKAVFCS